MLDQLDKLGIADDTFVMYSTDNGPHRNSWPDGGMTPFRSEKNTNWEGAFRIPLIVRWPGKIKAGRSRQRHRAAPRLAADVPRDGRRPRRRGEAEEGLQSDRPDLQESHRRRQPGPLPHRQGEGEPAQALRLLQRRWRRARPPLRQLEGGLHGATLHRARCRSGRSRSRACACRRSSTCAPIRTSLPTSRRTRIASGTCITPTSCRRLAVADKFAATFKDFPAMQKPNTFTIDDALAKMSEASSGG